MADLGAAEPIGDPPRGEEAGGEGLVGADGLVQGFGALDLPQSADKPTADSICRSRLTSQSGGGAGGLLLADIVTGRSLRARGSVLSVYVARHGSPRTLRPALQASIAPAGSDQSRTPSDEPAEASERPLDIPGREVQNITPTKLPVSLRKSTPGPIRPATIRTSSTSARLIHTIPMTAFTQARQWPRLIT